MMYARVRTASTITYGDRPCQERICAARLVVLCLRQRETKGRYGMATVNVPTDDGATIHVDTTTGAISATPAPEPPGIIESIVSGLAEIVTIPLDVASGGNLKK